MGELLGAFLRLGTLGFGGPIATLGMMEEEFVRVRGWLTAARFAEMYAVCKLLPGPVASQMAVYIGRERKGTWGGLISGGAFILPSFLIVLALSAVYVRAGAAVASAGAWFSGLQVGALAIIVFSVAMLARPYIRQPRAWPLFPMS